MFTLSRLLTAFGLFLFVLLLASFKVFQIQQAIANSSKFQPPPDAVTTVVLDLEPWQSTLEFVGTVAPVRGVMLSVEEAGRVSKIAVDSGTTVEEGQLLFQLDVSVEQANLKAAQGNFDLAGVSLKRARELFSRKANSQADLDTAQAQYAQAQGELEAIQAMIQRKTIRAPFAGKVGIRLINLGEYVTAGTALISLHNIDTVYVNFAAPQRYSDKLFVDQTVAVLAGQHNLAGKISALDPQFNVLTRNREIQVSLDNFEGLLSPGMFVRVRADVGEVRKVLTVPTSAIAYAPYGDSVYVVRQLTSEAGGEYQGVEQQIVRLGEHKGDRVVVESGLQVGDEVVSSGWFKLRPKGAVNVNNESQPSNLLDPKPSNS